MPSTAPESFIHVVAGVIRHPQNPAKILVTRRKKGTHLEDLWEFPGGKVEAGESRYQALQRELREELGLTLLAAQPFQSLFHRYAEKNIFLDIWEVKLFAGTAHGAEDQQMQWVNIGKLGNYAFPAADLPVISALHLPTELLITPDVSEGHENTFVAHFERLMEKHPYKLVQLRSHRLEDKAYLKVADRLREICKPSQAQLIISRPSLNSLKSTIFNHYSWRHLNSSILQSLTENPFDQDVKLSASCHDAQELTMAQRLGCRFALLSSVRETLSHPGRQAKGWFALRELIAHCDMPVYALGGVRRRDCCVARFQGAIGVAGISDFWTV